MLAYIMLGVTPKNSDTEIKEAYMNKSSEYSPDRHPERFKKIRESYEKIKTKQKRMQYDVFHHEEVTNQDLTGALLSQKNTIHLNPEMFDDYFKRLIK